MRSIALALQLLASFRHPRERASFPKPRRQRLVDHLVHQRRFTRPRHTCHRDHHVERNLDIDVLQIVRPRADHLQHPSWDAACGGVSASRPSARPSDSVDVNDCAPSLSRRRIRPGKQHAPAMLPRARAQIDDVVRRPHHVGIMLHDDDRVPQVPQFFQDPHQPSRVPACSPIEGSSST